ncbi:rRNA N-glycosidase [Rhynchospora pubera]|uniref:rRNA N-glycosylase n=1 Tax=Rhynchospora pubera TaxID=906938 RepID=A0AAV8E356_9POAL|nr:rRNA N-glycosidase [Rhynchospora pubera]
MIFLVACQCYPQSKVLATDFFHIVLAAGISSITVRIRTSDLYLVGFQAANQWYEYRPIDNNPRQIDNAVLLPFTGGYVNDGSLPQALVGRAPLAEAVTSLAAYNPNNRDNQQMLIRLILMFPEAFRFRAVADLVYGPMHDSITQQATIGPYIAELIHDWGALSMALRRSDLFASFNEFRGLGISNAAQLASLLGLVLWSSKTPTRPSFSTQAISTQAASDVTSKGRQLVEIFWVQILNIDNEDPGDLYGKIQIVDDLESPQTSLIAVTPTT